MIHRQNDQKVDRRANRDERHQRIDEITDRELAAIDREFDGGESGFSMSAAMRGMTKSLTSAVTTAPNAAPMTTATARSKTFPRSMNCLKPCSMARPPKSGGGPCIR